MNIIATIAQELAVKPSQVEAAVALLDEGSTVPFIARYRKEATDGLDDLQLRNLEDRLRYLRELVERRDSIVASIEEQGKMTPQLQQQIMTAQTKTELEDLYLPYKPKRRTKGMIAIEAGLEPLADALYADPMLDPAAEAEKYLDADKGVADVKAALEGARYILMERLGDDAALAGKLRSFLGEHGELRSKVVEEKTAEAEKFRDYFEYAELLSKVPSHRALAVFRGRKEGFLSVSIAVHGHEEGQPDPCEAIVASHAQWRDQGRPADKWLAEVMRWTWKVKLSLRMETDLLGSLRERSEEEAIRVFAANLKAILLAAPAGHKAILGLDPGLRTGVKVAVVDATGKYLENTTIYPHAPKNQWDASIDVLAKLCQRHGVNLVSIGNGTASRETDRLTADLMKRHPELQLKKMVVNEAGASVYSASDIAREEFPDLDVSIRGAVSIARRLQDPLAELVKIEPKSIGVGQYQHDVSQSRLGQTLDAVVEDCVNAVGVDVNMASAALLRRVSGLSASIAANIVNYRNQNGAFPDREALKAVPRLGDKCFEQCAGFLRISGGRNPLDASSVHPESYAVVERILEKNHRTVQQLVGDGAFLRGLKPADYVTEQVGIPTIKDILSELEKPGRDPRPEFRSADFMEGVEEIRDLRPGMILEGTITNVTNFGAFVDIGVHQDGLVHISVLSTKFVKDPHAVVKTGDVVKVKVIEVDEKRRRIALSMRLDDAAEPRAPRQEGSRGRNDNARYENRGQQPARAQQNATGSFGNLLKDAMKKR
ncbi:MAG TPA: Tex family protein [Hyphomicrobiales bacterium]|nr:Tex family protein [Hyphomicrobiales bacterium]